MADRAKPVDAVRPQDDTKQAFNDCGKNILRNLDESEIVGCQEKNLEENNRKDSKCIIRMF